MEMAEKSLEISVSATGLNNTIMKQKLLAISFCFLWF
jgi:hypothetical protein